MPAGRPTKYKKEFVEQGYKLAREGFIDRKIAGFFNIAVSNLNVWKEKHPEFQESIKKGKNEYDNAEVEQSLLNRALGRCKVKESTKELSPKVNPKTGKATWVTTKVVIKQLAPDVAAQFIWLKNRDSERWRDRSELQLGGSVTIIAPSVKKPKNAGT